MNSLNLCLTRFELFSILLANDNERRVKMAGKGDNRRPEDTKKIDKNWAEIDWSKKDEPKKGGQQNGINGK